MQVLHMRRTQYLDEVLVMERSSRSRSRVRCGTSRCTPFRCAGLALSLVLSAFVALSALALQWRPFGLSDVTTDHIAASATYRTSPLLATELSTALGLEEQLDVRRSQLESPSGASYGNEALVEASLPPGRAVGLEAAAFMIDDPTVDESQPLGLDAGAQLEASSGNVPLVEQHPLLEKASGVPSRAERDIALTRWRNERIANATSLSKAFRGKARGSKAKSKVKRRGEREGKGKGDWSWNEEFGSETDAWMDRGPMWKGKGKGKSKTHAWMWKGKGKGKMTGLTAAARLALRSSSDVLNSSEMMGLKNITNINIFGLYNSGTNSLAMLLHHVWPNISVCPDTDVGKRGWGKACQTKWALSKHSNPLYIERWFNDSATTDFYALFMLRDPIAHLASIRKHPYGLQSCVGPPWLQVPCFCGTINAIDPVCPPALKTFRSIVSVWTSYFKGYKRLAKLSWATRKGQSIMIRYEDLVLRPNEVLESISDLLGIALPDVDAVKLLNQKAKKNGVDHNMAVTRIMNQSYLETYNWHELKHLCAQLDKASRPFNYGMECDMLPSFLKNVTPPATPRIGGTYAWRSVAAYRKAALAGGGAPQIGKGASPAVSSEDKQRVNVSRWESVRLGQETRWRSLVREDSELADGVAEPPFEHMPVAGKLFPAKDEWPEPPSEDMLEAGYSMSPSDEAEALYEWYHRYR